MTNCVDSCFKGLYYSAFLPFPSPAKPGKLFPSVIIQYVNAAIHELQPPINYVDVKI